ncbi:MAG TPA: histidine triad nucleotide-binding protein [Acidiferrobacterales bacterium]|jgi:histidine triad (HIT) family protein
MTDCLFCKIVAGQVPSDRVHEDEQVVVFRDIHPKAPVHLLVVPRVHFESLNELKPEHDAVMSHILHLLPKLAKQQGLNDGFRTIINTGPGGGQIIFHLHVHLLGGGALPGF